MNYFKLDALTMPLTSIEGIKHAALQSLLNHAQATDNDRVRMGDDSRGGCWSEEYAPLVSSRDWTLHREKNLAQIRNMAEQFYRDSLIWMVEEHLIRAFDVTVIEASNTAIQRVVTLYTLDDKEIQITI